MSKKTTTKINDSVYPTQYGGINQGGLYNSYSGIGTQADKSRQSIFLPTLLNSRSELEVIFNESWAAKRFINLPIDQLFIRPRTFEDMKEETEYNYIKYLSEFNLNLKLANSMKSGRLYGSGFLIFITKEARLTDPLQLNILRPGDLLNIISFDRFSATVYERNINLTSKNYQLPDVYHITPKYGQSFDCHASRLLRFDGQMPLASDGWDVYDRDYGVSELIPVIQSIYQESQGANGVSQLIEEASISVFKSQYLRESSQSLGGDSPTLRDLANQVDQNKSIYNSVFIDSDDDYSRQEVTFTDLPAILDRFASRLAAAAGIPATIFLGRSPAGQNATGESDLRINSDKVTETQENKLRPSYDFIDKIMTRTGGFSNEFTYDFPKLFKSGEKEQADVAFTKVQSVVQAVNADIMTTDEARGVLDGDSIIGNLEDENVNFSKAVASEQAQQNNNNLSKFRDIFDFKKIFKRK